MWYGNILGLFLTQTIFLLTPVRGQDSGTCFIVYFFTWGGYMMKWCVFIRACCISICQSHLRPVRQLWGLVWTTLTSKGQSIWPCFTPIYLCEQVVRSSSNFIYSNKVFSGHLLVHLIKANISHTFAALSSTMRLGLELHLLFILHVITC